MSFNFLRIWLVAVLGAITALTIFFTVRIWRSHRLAHWIAALACLTLLSLTALASVNYYFKYIPTVGGLFGKSKDAVPLAKLEPHLGAAAAANPTPDKELPTHGKVVAIAIPGAVSGFQARKAEVYLPPRWFMAGTKPLPVIELLHGTPGAPEDWVRGGGVQDDADTWAKQNNGYAPIFIMPDPNGAFTADTECVNGKRGNAETYLTQDVRNFARDQLHASTDRKHWAVGGLSEGGYCGAMLTLRHPDTFSIFLDFGGDPNANTKGGPSALFTGSAKDAATAAANYDLHNLLQSHDPKNHLGGWFISGAGDQDVVKSNRELNTLAIAKHVDAHLFVVHGRHTFDTWKQSLAHAFPDTAERIDAIDQHPSG